MSFFRDLRRLGARLLAPAAVSLALLTACGGGTSQQVAFAPDRLLVFGDENSVIVDDGTHDGYKYTINDRRGVNVGKCQSSAIFVQSIAAQYGFTFAECNPLGIDPRAFIHAVAGAMIEDPVNGLAAQIASVPDLHSPDLVSVMIGTNDIIAIYQRVLLGQLTSGDAVNEARRLGNVVAQQVSGILATGARALVVTVPDVGLSPYAVTASQQDPGAVPLLSQLSYEFNGTMRTNIVPNDGRYFALVLADDIVTAMYKNPSSYLDPPHNINTAACTTDPGNLVQCVLTDDPSTTTLQSDATLGNYLWAGDHNVGPQAHSRIGSQAVARAVGNPF